MGRLTRAIVKTAVVIGVGAAGATLRAIALRTPTTELGDIGPTSITVWPNVEHAPVWLDLTLQPSGRIDFGVVSEFPSPPGTDENGRWHAVGPFQQATQDGPAVTAIADVVFLEVGCGSAFDPSSLVMGEGIPIESVTFESPCRPDGGGDGYQTITVTLKAVSETIFRTDVDGVRTYGSGANQSHFSLQPRGRWSDASLGSHIATLPGLFYGQYVDETSLIPTGGASAGPFSHLSATIKGSPGDLIDKVIPAENAQGSAESQSEEWQTMWDAQSGDEQEPLLPALVRWTDPAGESWAQGLLLAAGVLIGVASSLAIEFLLSNRREST